MAECNPDEKSTGGKVDLTSMSSVLKIILGAFSVGQKPALSLPPPIAIIGKELKPGMSPRNLAARQMAAAEAIGIAMGDIFSDGPNKIAQLVLSDRKEENKEMVNNMAVEGYADLGTVQSAVTGSAGPIPIVGTATNVTPIKFKGGVT